VPANVTATAADSEPGRQLGDEQEAELQAA
jgi:hypothetical protein